MQFDNDYELIPDEFFIGKCLGDFLLISEIGRGAHGVVYKVRSNINGKIYALKKIKLEHLKPEKVKDALVEVKSMRKVKHKNIIQYHNSFFTNKALYIVMQYAECGDMHEVGFIHFYIIKLIVYCTLQDIDEIYSRGRHMVICLRSLQSSRTSLGKQYYSQRHQNFKYILGQKYEDKGKNQFFDYKINQLGDLGVSEIMGNKMQMQGERVGTPLFLSPEVIQHQAYGFGVDVWSIGCVIYYLAAQRPPFIGDNMITLGYNIVHKFPENIPDAYSPELKNLIIRLLNKNPKSRPKISDIYRLFPSNIQNLKQEKKKKPKYQIRTKEKIRKLNFVDNYAQLVGRRIGPFKQILKSVQPQQYKKFNIQTIFGKTNIKKALSNSFYNQKNKNRNGMLMQKQNSVTKLKLNKFGQTQYYRNNCFDKRNLGTYQKKFKHLKNKISFDFSKQGKNVLEKKNKKDTSFTQANFHTTIDTIDPGYSTVQESSHFNRNSNMSLNGVNLKFKSDKKIASMEQSLMHTMKIDDQQNIQNIQDKLSLRLQLESRKREQKSKLEKLNLITESDFISNIQTIKTKGELPLRHVKLKQSKSTSRVFQRKRPMVRSKLKKKIILVECSLPIISKLQKTTRVGWLNNKWMKKKNQFQTKDKKALDSKSIFSSQDLRGKIKKDNQAFTRRTRSDLYLNHFNEQKNLFFKTESFNKKTRLSRKFTINDLKI